MIWARHITSHSHDSYKHTRLTQSEYPNVFNESEITKWDDKHAINKRRLKHKGKTMKNHKKKKISHNQIDSIGADMMFCFFGAIITRLYVGGFKEANFGLRNC